MPPDKSPDSFFNYLISTALGVVPDMLTLGDKQIDGGWMRLKPTITSRRSFVGNGA